MACKVHNIFIEFNINRVTFIRHSYNHSCTIHTGFLVSSSSIVTEPAVALHSVEVAFGAYLAQQPALLEGRARWRQG
jgi:hypothetical protein